jgi:ABC-2 type transport system permease protein
MNVSLTRVGAIVRKELREYRRNRSVVLTMAVIPLIFVLNPLISIFALPASASAGLKHVHLLLYMLGIPAVVPAVVAAYSVVGERQQGSLEPVLMTPISRAEFLLAKAFAALAPALVISYVVYAVVLVAIWLFAKPDVTSALIQGPDLVVQILFTPLLAGWSIWVGIAVSDRASEARTAQQLGTLASVPSAIVVILIAYDVVHATPALAVGGAVLLVALNGLGWWITSRLFDRERLITSSGT